MANRLWEYRNSSAGGEMKSAYCTAFGIFQLMSCNDDAELSAHLIEEIADTTEVSALLPQDQDAMELKMDAAFSLVPKVFKDTAIPGFEGSVIARKLDDQVFLRFQGSENSSHVMVPLYYEARKRAMGKSNYMLSFLNGNLCFILYFKNGVCELANAYPFANDSEILYYCMAVIKKSGLDVRQVQFEILGNQSKEVVQVFRRFVANVGSVQLELPYPTGEYPPHAAESYLLYQFLTCELPVDL